MVEAEGGNLKVPAVGGEQQPKGNQDQGINNQGEKEEVRRTTIRRRFELEEWSG